VEALGFLMRDAEYPPGPLGEAFEAVCHYDLPFRWNGRFWSDIIILPNSPFRRTMR
jgi:hypothetical protein